jgi:glycosyltransferase involved in cell wall biosynthesis
VCAPDWGGIAASGARNPARLLIWSEATAVTEAGIAAPKRALRRRLYRRASGFLVPGRLARDYLESMGCVGPFVAMPNTIDEPRFWLNDAGIAAKFAVKMPRLITFSGSLIERKGVDVLLLAFAAACAREPAAAATTRLRIIGAGPLQQPHQAMPNVEFTGHLDGDAYRCAMQQSQVFVLPSRSDCNPLVVVEALNCGTALILSDGVGSHPEALQTNGALVPRGDVRALTDALAWMMTCPTGELHAMAQRSRGIAAAFGTATAREQFVAGVVASLRADVPMEAR